METIAELLVILFAKSKSLLMFNAILRLSNIILPPKESMYQIHQIFNDNKTNNGKMNFFIDIFKICTINIDNTERFLA